MPMPEASDPMPAVPKCYRGFLLLALYLGVYSRGDRPNLQSNIEKRDPLSFLKEFKGSRYNQSIYLRAEIFLASCFFLPKQLV